MYKKNDGPRKSEARPWLHGEHSVTFGYFSVKDDYDHVSLAQDLKLRKEEGILEKNLVFVFSKETGLNDGDVKRLIEDLKGHRIFIADLTGGLSLQGEEITLIDFGKVCREHKEYLGIGAGGLSDEGYRALAGILKQALDQ